MISYSIQMQALAVQYSKACSAVHTLFNVNKILQYTQMYIYFLERKKILES